MEKEIEVTIEVLLQGSGGELVFKPVKVTPSNIKALLEAEKNSMIKENLRKEAKRKKLNIKV